MKRKFYRYPKEILLEAAATHPSVVAEKYSLSYDGLRDACNREGLSFKRKPGRGYKKKPNPALKEKNDLAFIFSASVLDKVNLRESGLSLEAIACKYNVSRQAIEQCIKKFRAIKKKHPEFGS